jgi:BirA family transcriptional regulator, biotin operon repressor / biotin---[acetyl-CoA-carboxylase] ligase
MLGNKNVKNIILQKLKENTSGYISGEVISGELCVSRTAIWKYIKELKKDGYIIESSSKKGYKLTSIPDIINSCEVVANLSTEILGKKIYYFDVVDSTNNYAKKIATEGCEDGTVVISEKQTAGRGRLGREWNSSDSKGIRISIVLRPELVPEDVQIITLAAAISVSYAIKEATGMDSGIKWPNDIILDGKKVCGILTEMSSETGRVNHIVLGIGINVNQDIEDFPMDLRDIAVSLKMNALKENIELPLKYGFDRSMIIKALLVNLEHLYSAINNYQTDEIITKWKNLSVTLGKHICITLQNKQIFGIAKDITKDGKLIVACADGTEQEVISGEVKVRGIMGYT